MSEEISIVIPDRVEYTKGLFCPVSPPQSYMSISFTEEGQTEPFREGFIKGRKCPEIAAFMFKPRSKPFEAGSKITVNIKCYESYDKVAELFGNVITEQTGIVQIL